MYVNVKRKSHRKREDFMLRNKLLTPAYGWDSDR